MPNFCMSNLTIAKPNIMNRTFKIVSKEISRGDLLARLFIYPFKTVQCIVGQLPKIVLLVYLVIWLNISIVVFVCVQVILVWQSK